MTTINNMTQEEKAKRYDETLEELRGLLECIHEEKREILEEDITSIFPELKDSEDERIRKWLISQLKIKSDNTDSDLSIMIDKSIAWLEKQGENHDDKYNITGIKSKHAEGKLGEMIKEIKSTDKVELKFKVGDWIVNNDSRVVNQVTEIRDDEYCLWPLDAEVMGYLRIIDVDNDHHLWNIKDAKDGDILVYNNSIFIFNEICKNCLIYYGIYEDNKFHNDKSYSSLVLDTIDISNIHPATKEQRDLLFQKIKEAGYEWDSEKKQLRKMEHDKSKFQILKAAWYVCTCTTCAKDSRIWFNNGTAYLGSEILKYDLGFEPEEYQNYFRLWTIKDAKDGDILASKSGNKIFSYRGNLDLRGNPCAYYGIYKVHDGICFSPCAIGNSFTYEEVVPATKEQRKILFEERTAAGGVLHFSKKELKKIEQKSFWSEEDENIKEWIMSDINKLLALNKKSFVIADKEIIWLKSLKGRVGCETNCTTTKKWKPSDEQIKHLTDVVYDAKHKNRISTNGYEPYSYLYALLMQLKKLKGE